MHQLRGFPPAAFAFYAALEENNEKAWFEANRETFESAVKAPLAALMEAGAEAFGGTVRISRPFRDVRFSQDKTPYKTRLFGALHPAEAMGQRRAGLYAGVSAEGVRAGAGYYDMAPDQVTRFRAAVADDDKAATLEEALAGAGKTLAVRGRSLKTAPKGYPRDHPRLALLRMKELIVVREFPPEACGAGLGEKVFAVWRAALPVLEWCHRHVGPEEMPEARRPARRR